MPPERTPHAPADPGDVSYDELVGLLRDPAVALVDVLPRASFDSGHIPGAISLPLDDIPSRAAALLPDLTRDIVVYCGGPT